LNEGTDCKILKITGSFYTKSILEIKIKWWDGVSKMKSGYAEFASAKLSLKTKELSWWDKLLLFNLL
jgi:predicted nucleic-acid-binding Zn-ribbon protein